ncbi:MAG: transglutaminaseTgpA domain-containing protein [Myxococcota bacterium]
MTLRYGYELGFALACTSALLIVLLGGEIPLPAWAAIASIWLAMLLRLRERTVPAWVGTFIGFASLATGAAMVASQGIETLVLGATVGIIGLLAGRVLTRTELGHDIQALLLTLLLVFAGAGLNTELSYGAAFVVYAITVVWALVTRQLVDGAHREASRRGGAAVETTLARRDVVTPTFFAVSALLSVIILSGTLILFVLFPRVGLGTFGMAFQGRRLPDSVSLRSPPRGGLSAAVVARVTGLSETEYNRGLYLRAATYDRLTKNGFERASVGQYPSEPRFQRLAWIGEEHGYEVFLQPVTGKQLLTLGPAKSLRILGGGDANPSRRGIAVPTPRPNGDVTMAQGLSGPVRYSVKGAINTSRPPPPVPDPNRLPDAVTPWLELPEQVDRRVFELANTVVAGAETAQGKADALRRYFLREFDYTLAQPTAGSDDPLSDFVLEVKAGHCEHFATGYATMLRAVGVPARVVGGFQGGLWDSSSDTVVFRLNNAHAWVEWYLPSQGWVTDDATPPFLGDTLGFYAEWVEWARRSWDEYVVDYALLDQILVAQQVRQSFRDGNLLPAIDRNSLRRIAAGLGALALLALAVHMLLGWRRKQRRDPLAEAIERNLSQRVKSPLPTHVTFREMLQSLETTSRARALLAAIDTYEARRFGDAPLNVTKERALIRALNSPGPVE